ncbi:hypothetical protein [Paenibacillus sp.]|uniref:hypothetical protein n=1 Tax=Paenibacillus sp. TaxID=58172 RepID=UPI002D4AFC79|nr:hypothetical protein [Paenibacillus sp.]HZG55458.1 hypothetical protein [Paenibacillus sp.]
MTNRDSEESVVERFLRLSDGAESKLLRVIVTLFVLLVVFQGLLTIRPVRERLTRIDRMEGQTYGFAPYADRVVYYTSAKAGLACFSLRDGDVCGVSS